MNLSVGHECVEGGVEDRGQVKLKHGAKEKQRPPASLTSLHTTAQRNMTVQDSFRIKSFCRGKKPPKALATQTGKGSEVNCRLLVCDEEEGQRSAVSVGVHLYRVAPSLYNSIPGVVWRFFSVALFRGPPAPPGGWGTESHSLSVPEFSSLHQTGGPQLLLLLKARA